MQRTLGRVGSNLSISSFTWRDLSSCGRNLQKISHYLILWEG